MSKITAIFLENMLKVKLGEFSAYIGGDHAYLLARKKEIDSGDVFIISMEKDCVIIRLGRKTEVIMTKKL